VCDSKEENVIYYQNITSFQALDTADIGNLPCEEELVVDVHSFTVSGLPLPVCI
jgi:hypothetical protein